MSEIQTKRQITQTKKLRDELIQRLVENPANSETAMQIIGLNKVIEYYWHDLGSEAKWEEGMSPYLRGNMA